MFLLALPWTEAFIFILCFAIILFGAWTVTANWNQDKYKSNKDKKNKKKK